MARFTGFVRGDTVHIDMTLTDAGAPDDLTGCTLWVTLKTDRANPDPGDLQVEQAVPAGPAAVAGQARVTLPSDKTKLLTPGKYWMDVQRVRPGAPPDVWTPFPPTQILVEADVTNSDA